MASAEAGSWVFSLRPSRAEAGADAGEGSAGAASAGVASAEADSWVFSLRPLRAEAGAEAGEGSVLGWRVRLGCSLRHLRADAATVARGVV